MMTIFGFFRALPHRLIILTLLVASPLAAQPARVLCPQEASVSVNGAVIDYQDLGGKGRPLLLITGYAVTMEMWDQEFVKNLAARHRVILMDNRGMGEHPSPPGPMNLQQLAADAAGLLDSLGIRKADVLGWSMGGMTAQELALRRPELVNALVLYATASDGSSVIPAIDRMAAMNPEQLRAAMFPAGFAAARPDVFNRLPARPRPPDMLVIARQYDALREWHVGTERLDSLRMPVLLLSGGQDWVCPPEESRRIADSVSGARLVLVPGGGHWMMHQQPEKLAKLVDEFLMNTMSPRN